ncbi:hypothetical protein DFH09DRAFT_1332278 [Mycena vulgaris]|nr:hypothetical protein DFH09DRAFT_1332278 [Mycena vulgaris]
MCARAATESWGRLPARAGCAALPFVPVSPSAPRRARRNAGAALLVLAPPPPCAPMSHIPASTGTCRIPASARRNAHTVSLLVFAPPNAARASCAARARGVGAAPRRGSPRTRSRSPGRRRRTPRPSTPPANARCNAHTVPRAAMASYPYPRAPGAGLADHIPRSIPASTRTRSLPRRASSRTRTRAPHRPLLLVPARARPLLRPVAHRRVRGHDTFPCALAAPALPGLAPPRERKESLLRAPPRTCTPRRPRAHVAPLAPRSSTRASSTARARGVGAALRWLRTRLAACDPSCSRGFASSLDVLGRHTPHLCASTHSCRGRHGTCSVLATAHTPHDAPVKAAQCSRPRRGGDGERAGGRRLRELDEACGGVAGSPARVRGWRAKRSRHATLPSSGSALAFPASDSDSHMEGVWKRGLASVGRQTNSRGPGPTTLAIDTAARLLHPFRFLPHKQWDGRPRAAYGLLSPALDAVLGLPDAVHRALAHARRHPVRLQRARAQRAPPHRRHLVPAFLATCAEGAGAREEERWAEEARRRCVLTGG